MFAFSDDRHGIHIDFQMPRFTHTTQPRGKQGTTSLECLAQHRCFTVFRGGVVVSQRIAILLKPAIQRANDVAVETTAESVCITCSFIQRSNRVIRSRGIICRSGPELCFLRASSASASSRIRTPLVSVGMAGDIHHSKPKRCNVVFISANCDSVRAVRGSRTSPQSIPISFMAALTGIGFVESPSISRHNGKSL